MPCQPPKLLKPHLLIDGYNVVHAWPWLRAQIPRGIDTAAALLVERVRILHDSGEVFATVVFDGRGQRLESVGKRKGDIEVLYAPSGSSADAIIEQVVLRAPDPSNFIVASRDNMVRETVFIQGARTITPEELEDWIEKLERRQTKELRERSDKTDRRFGNRLF